MSKQGIGRNSPCPCGSGKKFKACCLRNEAGKGKTDAKERVVLCWALDRVRQRIPQPIFERRLYKPSSEQAQFLIAVCAESGALALEFGRRVFELALDSLKGQPVDSHDERGLVLGFHGKALDQLVGIRALAKVGSLGPAMAAVRVLFETFVHQTYLLKVVSCDTENCN